MDWIIFFLHELYNKCFFIPFTNCIIKLKAITGKSQHEAEIDKSTDVPEITHGVNLPIDETKQTVDDSFATNCTEKGSIPKCTVQVQQENNHDELKELLHIVKELHVSFCFLKNEISEIKSIVERKQNSARGSKGNSFVVTGSNL